MQKMSPIFVESGSILIEYSLQKSSREKNLSCLPFAQLCSTLNEGTNRWGEGAGRENMENFED
jgi:hypothetical protein